MRCHSCKNNLSAFLDGELSGEPAALVEAHLQGCVSCRRELEALKGIDTALDALGDLEPVSDFTERVLRRIAAEGDGEKVVPVRAPARGRRVTWKIAASLAAAACIAAAVLVTLHLAGGGGDVIADPPEIVIAELDMFAEMELLSDMDVIENLDALEALEQIDDLDAFLEGVDDTQ